MKRVQIDFFNKEYQTELARTDRLFGINDAVQQHSEKGVAYTTTDDSPRSWNSVVHNEENKVVQFVPLDHNIVIHPAKGLTYSLCDGMLYHEKYWLAFVELKIRKGNWITENIKQLHSTIELFRQNHQVENFIYRFAYAVNRRFPQFHYSKKSEMQKFHQQTGFRLLIQRDIEVR